MVLIFSSVIAPRPSVTQAAKMMILLVLALAASAHGARLDKQGTEEEYSVDIFHYNAATHIYIIYFQEYSAL